jgi:uncharacterized protein YndB with AHSA1/START domain
MNLAFSTDIRCPPKRLWPWLTEPERMKQWMKGLVRIEPDDPAAVRVGHTAKLVIKEGGRERTYDEKILEWTPNERILISIAGEHMKGMEMLCGYRLQDLGGSTRLDYTLECRTTRTLFKILGAIFGVFAKMQARHFIKTLKKLAEENAFTAA